MRLPYKTIKVRWILLDLHVRWIIKTAAKKLSLMTYASHARVITEIIQANLILLSIKMTTPHQSGAPFVGERVFQNRGVCGQAFPSFPSPTPFLQPFCSRPIFHASRMRKTNTRCPNFVRFVRERLLRRLDISRSHVFRQIKNKYRSPAVKSFQGLKLVGIVARCP